VCWKLCSRGVYECGMSLLFWYVHRLFHSVMSSALKDEVHLFNAGDLDVRSLLTLYFLLNHISVRRWKTRLASVVASVVCTM